MICVPEADLIARAKSLPVSYLEDCRAYAQISPEGWCFDPQNYSAIRKKYRGFTLSASHQDPGQPISGCCDRADQY